MVIALILFPAETRMANETNLTTMAAGAEQRSGAADWVILSLPGLIWGASYLFIADALGAIGPGGVTFVRLAVGFLTLLCFSSAGQPGVGLDWLRVLAVWAFLVGF